MVGRTPLAFVLPTVQNQSLVCFDAHGMLMEASSINHTRQQTGRVPMNVQPTVEIAKSSEQHGYARLQGRWLLLARCVWGALVVFTLVVVFASLPIYIAQLERTCAGVACEYQQLTPEQAAALKGMGLSLAGYAAYTIALLLISIAVCLAVSALIVWRRSNDRMALIVALLLITLGPIIETIDFSAANSSPWLIPNECLGFLPIGLLLLVFSLFPSGQFVPSFMRWTLVVFIVIQIPLVFFPSASFMPDITVSQPGWLVSLGEMATLALVQIYRYRKVSSPRQRQQTKWIVFGFAVPVTIHVGLTVPGVLFPDLTEHSSLYLLISNEQGFLLPLCLPLSFGFAMLRYRLWEIDALINRTLVYGVLTLILTSLYVGLIFGLQALLRGIVSQNSDVAIVVSTLAIAALFQPLRQRIQALIDRRFYRRRYDAAKTLQAFNTSLRNEMDLSHLSEQLLAVVGETMQPASLSLWLCQPQQHSTEAPLSTINSIEPHRFVKENSHG
jgi:hypothetical protein